MIHQSEAAMSEVEVNTPLLVSTYHIYRERWVILLAQSLLAFCNGMIWCTYAPIASSSATFYAVSEAAINWLSLVFIIFTIVLLFPSSWFLEKFDLRCTLYLCAVLNLLATVSRLLSVVLGEIFWLVLIGQIFASCGQGFIMIAPTKIAGLWFKEDQRAIANTIGTLSNTIGVMCMTLLAPVFILKSVATGMLNMAILLLALSVLGCLSMFFVRNSKPKSPPSISANVEHPPFFQSLKMALTTKSFLILSYCFGNGIAIITTILTLLQQMLCVQGYSSLFAGISGALLFACGIPGAALASMYTDRNGKFEYAAKLAFGLSAAILCAFVVCVRYPDIPYVIAAVMALFGFVGFSLYSTCLQLGVECTYPVPESVSSAVIMLSGQVQSVIWILLMQLFTVTEAPSEFSTCHFPSFRVLDYTNSDLLLVSVTALNSVGFILFFHCEYKRMDAEKIDDTNRLLAKTLQHRRSLNS